MSKKRLKNLFFSTNEIIGNLHSKTCLTQTLNKLMLTKKMKPEKYILFGKLRKNYWEQKDYLSDFECKSMLDKTNN